MRPHERGKQCEEGDGMDCVRYVIEGSSEA